MVCTKIYISISGHQKCEEHKRIKDKALVCIFLSTVTLTYMYVKNYSKEISIEK